MEDPGVRSSVSCCALDEGRCLDGTSSLVLSAAVLVLVLVIALEATAARRLRDSFLCHRQRRSISITSTRIAANGGAEHGRLIAGTKRLLSSYAPTVGSGAVSKSVT